MILLKVLIIVVIISSLKFQSIQGIFFLTFLFSIYEIVDIMNICKPLNIAIETVTKNPEMLKIIPDHLKIKKMCKQAVKKIPHLLIPHLCF